MAPYTPAGETRAKIYTFMRERILAGCTPTVREVQKTFGFRAVQSAQQHLEALVKEGLLTKALERRSRGYLLAAGPGGAAITNTWVPLLGRVQAGALTTALEDPEGYMAVQKTDGRQSDQLFALRVKGESMKNAGILDGDIVIVQRTQAAENGDTVVALVGDEATVKKFQIHKGRVRLLAENDAFEPIVPDPAKLTILGKVVEVRRYLNTSGPPLGNPGAP